MGQPEILFAIAKLCEQYGRSVTKQEIVDEVGVGIGSVNYALVQLCKWNEIKVETKPRAERGRPFMYSLVERRR